MKLTITSIPGQTQTSKMRNIVLPSSEVIKEAQAGASTGLMTGPLSALATIPQLGAKVFGRALIGDTQEKIESNQESMRKVAQGFISLADKENDPERKKQLLRQALQTTNEMRKSSALVEDLRGEIAKRQRIETPIGTIPALSDEPGRVLGQTLGRGVATVGILGAPGPITAGMGIRGGMAIEEGKNVLPQGFSLSDVQNSVLGQTMQGAVEGKILGSAFNYLGGTRAGQAVLGSRPAQLIGNVLEKVRATPSSPGTLGNKLDVVAQNIESGLNKAMSPGTYARPILKPLQARAVDKLEADYDKWTGATKTGVKRLGKAEARTEALNRAGTEGERPSRILAEERIVPKTEGTKFRTAEQAQEYRDSLWPFKNAKDEAVQFIDRAVTPVPMQSLEQNTISRVSKMPIAEGSKESMIKEIRAEFDLLRQKFGDTMRLAEMNVQNPVYWGEVKFDSTRPFAKDAYYQIGKSLQKAIQDKMVEGGFNDVAQLNRVIGDRLEAAKFLESLDGQTLKYGKLGRYIFMGIGSTLGNTVFGKVAGALTGDLVGQILMKASVSSPVKTMILKSIATQNPEAYMATIKWLQKQGVIQSLRPKLPAPRLRPLGSSENPILTQPPTTYEAGVQSQRPAALSNKTAIPMANKVSNIVPNATTKTVPLSSIGRNELDDVFDTLVKAGMSKERALIEVIGKDMVDEIKSGIVPVIKVQQSGNTYDIVDGMHHELGARVLGMRNIRINLE